MANLQTLVELLQDESERVRREALDALIETGSPEAIPHVVSALGDPDEWVRSGALWGIYKLEISDAIPSVVKLLQDPHEQVRGTAAATLGRLEERSAVPALVQAYRSEQDNDARGEIRDALIELADPQAAGVYLELLSSSEEREQEQAMQALGHAPDKRAIPQLVKLLKSPGELDRDDIIDLLVVLDAREAVSEIERCIRDRDPSVRESAARALGRLGREKSKKALRRAMRDRELDVQVYAAQSLGMLGELEPARQLLHKRYDALKGTLDRQRDVDSGPVWHLIRIGGALGRVGERETAIGLLRELNRISQKQGWTFPERSSWDLLREFGVTVVNPVFERSAAEKEGRDGLGAAQGAPAVDPEAGLDDPRFRADAWYLPDEPLFGLVEIPEGAFRMGSDLERDVEAYGDECPQHEVTLPRYYLARCPVTGAQFRAFVEQSGYKQASQDALAGQANHPVVWTTLQDAYAYCDWLTETLCTWEATPAPLRALLRDEGWRFVLPSEAEWEKAARGGLALPDGTANPAPGRLYPWGDAIDPGKANYKESGLGRTSPVGSFPDGASPYGLLDLCGNVWERTRSLFKGYPYDLEDGRDAVGGPERAHYVLRGGAFQHDARDVRCALRYKGPAAHPRWHIGFRIALARIEPEPEPEEPALSFEDLMSRFKSTFDG